ncbi:DUF4194 domain-containing protein, partial [Rhodoferax sp.]|uniref:DUF4194 domain-containing protein n=1 Tax=Rhodoferax sp. TaxID=50421 RepID=UPI0039B9A96B
VVPLLKGVLYRDDDAPLWAALLSLQMRVRDYVAVLGLTLALDEAEGYRRSVSPTTRRPGPTRASARCAPMCWATTSPSATNSVATPNRWPCAMATATR